MVNKQVTMLYRQGGEWSDAEMRALTKLSVFSAHPRYPEYLLLSGEFDEGQILKALGNNEEADFTVIVTDLRGTDLPFIPSFF